MNDQHKGKPVGFRPDGQEAVVAGRNDGLVYDCHALNIAWADLDADGKDEAIFTSGDATKNTHTHKIPAGMTVSAGDTISWIPTTDSVYMEHVEFAVSNGSTFIFHSVIHNVHRNRRSRMPINPLIFHQFLLLLNSILHPLANTYFSNQGGT